MAELKGTPQAPRSSLGQASSGTAGGMFATHVNQPPATVVGQIHQGGGSQLLQHLLKIAGRTADQYFDYAAQREYLNGAAAVGAGIAEEDLEHNIITKAWKVAGHRNYTARYALEDYQATLAESRSKDAAQYDPEGYVGRLAEARAKIEPILKQATTGTQTQLFTSLLTLERDAINKHKEARGKHIAEFQQQQRTIGFNQATDNVLQSSPETRGTAVDSLVAKAVNEIALADDLPYEAKSKQLTELATYMLENGDRSFVAYMKGMQVDALGGTLWDTMSYDDRIKVSKALEKANNNALFTDKQQAFDWVRDVELDIHSGNLAAVPPLDQLKDNLNYMVAEDIITPQKATSILKQYTAANKGNALAAENLSAYTNGQYGVLHKNGAYGGDIAKAYTKHLLEGGRDIADAAVAQLQVYGNTGNPHAAKEAAQLLAPAVAALRSADLESPDDAKNLITLITSQMDMLDQSGREGVMRNALINALPDQDRDFMHSLMTELTTGKDQMTALQDTREQWLQWQNMSDTEKSIKRQVAAGVLGDVRDELSDPKGLIARLTPFFRGAGYSVRHSTGLFSGDNPVASGHFHRNVMPEVMRIAQAELHRNPYLTADQVVEIASQRLLANSVETEQGLIVVPEKENLADVLGVKGVNPHDLLGRVVNEIYEKPHKDIQSVATYRNGEVSIQHYNTRTGEVGGSFVITSEELREGAAAVMEAVANDDAKVYGVGEYVHVPHKGNGGKVRVNGNNTAGIEPKLAYDIRKSLAQFERVTYETYEDGRTDDGRTLYSIGAGINTGNPIFDKYFKVGATAPQEAVDRSFEEATDSVLHEANQVAVEIHPQFNNDAYMTVLTHLLYQSGKPRLTKNKDFQAMQRYLAEGEIVKAQAALGRIPAYKQAGKDRKKFYSQTFNKIRTK